MSKKQKLITKQFKCPCGQGKVVIGYDAENISSAIRSRKIKCPDCKEKYRWIAEGHLLPKDYPDYCEHPDTLQKIRILKKTIDSYTRGEKAWYNQLSRTRDKMCAISLVLGEHNILLSSSSILPHSVCLYRRYSKEDLKAAYDDFLSTKHQSQLKTEIAKQIAEEYQLTQDVDRLSEIILPIYAAVQNYSNYALYDAEDAFVVSVLEDGLRKYKAECFNGYAEYKAERDKHLVQFDCADEIKD